MHAKNFYQLEPITIGDKKIYPISLLKVIMVKNTFLNVDYEVSAFKIIEDKKVYYKNVNLSQQDFEYVESSF